MGVLIGVTFGHRQGPTALAVVEDELRPASEGRRVDHYLVRYLERLPAGTPYPQVASRLAEIVQTLTQRGSDTPYVYVNATGMGEPLIEMIERAVRGSVVCAVYFTHGDRRTEGDGAITLGKGYLVAQLKLLLATDRLHLTRTPEAETLARDLMEYEVEVKEDANERYGAFRVGKHDDLITALGLAVHKRRQVSVYGPGD